MRIIAGKVKRAVESRVDKALRTIGRYLPEKMPEGTRILSGASAHFYCGYYDVTPFNQDNSILLAMRVAGGNISPHESMARVDVGYFNMADGSFVNLGQTSAWNWQQGARQQWLPDGNFIYNDFQEGRFVSVVRSIQNQGPLRKYEYPIYLVHKNGNEALSLDFARLHSFRRGYGYHNIPGSAEHAPTNEGLWHINLHDGARILLVSLAQLSVHEPQENMQGAYHYINHLQWTPDGENIVFFHLWHHDGKKKNSRLIMLQSDGTLATIARGVRPSHTGWAEDGTLLLTGLKTASKNIYHLYHDLASQDIELNITVDGHPSFISNTCFISDTYPDTMGHQTLYISDARNNRQGIASFYLPADYTGEMRCDLHPRLSPDKKLCAVDIVKDGKRAIAIIPVKP